MLSVIISTEGAEKPTAVTLAALVPGAVAGLIREVLLVDGTDNGAIERVADVAGCRFIGFRGPHGAALAAGAQQARSPWLMFLRTGAVLESGWIEETTQFIQSASLSDKPRAAVFRYARSPHTNASLSSSLGDAFSLLAWRIVGPSVDQGLVIARGHYDQLGGHPPHARRSEARLLRRLGRSSRTLLRSRIMMMA